MDNTYIAKQLEFYSNAIVAFVVVQSLTFCYNFGTNEMLNRILRTYKALSAVILVSAALVVVLAVLATRFMSARLQTISPEYSDIVRTVYRAKIGLMSLFGALQVYVIGAYAVLGSTP